MILNDLYQDWLYFYCTVDSGGFRFTSNLVDDIAGHAVNEYGLYNGYRCSRYYITVIIINSSYDLRHQLALINLYF